MNDIGCISDPLRPYELCAVSGLEELHHYWGKGLRPHDDCSMVLTLQHTVLRLRELLSQGLRARMEKRLALLSSHHQRGDAS
jgi:hypothetical protein